LVSDALQQKSSQKGSQKILELIKNNNSITRTEIASAVGIGERAVQKQLDKLKAEGVLVRVGGRKEGHWEIIQD